MPRRLPVLLAVAGVVIATMTTSYAAAATPDTDTGSASLNVCPTTPAPGHMTCLMQVLPGRSQSVPMSVLSSGRKTPAYSDPNSPNGFAGYTPTDLRAAYAIPATTATTTVAVVDAFGDSAVQTRLNYYRKSYGLPACTGSCFTKVDQNGGTNYPADDSGWAQETDLDVQMVSAVCPSCHILLVETKSDNTIDLVAGVQTATRLGARYVSMSWGGPDTTNDPNPYLDSPATTYVAAAGDDNYAAGPFWPGTSNKVIAVGGTALYPTRSNARGWTETAWHTDANDGTGSGCAVDDAQPSWQAAFIGGVCSTRAANDMAMVADPATGVSVYTDGGWAIAGGTSASTPMVAALAAMTGETNGTSAPGYAYAHSGAFTDVVTDPNPNSCGTRICFATTGWDGPTGLGTPYGVGAFGTVINVGVHSPGTVSSRTGTRVSLDVHGTSSVAGRSIRYSVSGAPAGVSVTASGLLAGSPSRAGRYTVTITATDSAGAQGSTSFSWTVNNHTFAASSARVAKTGGTLRVSGLTWRADSSRGAKVAPKLKYQWLVGGKVLRGATSSTLPVGRLAQGRSSSVRVRITATLSGYTTKTVTSAALSVRR